MSPRQFLAFDLGAESGRAILGTLTDNHLALEEVHRFPNEPVRLPTGLYWDLLRLFHEISKGLSIAGRTRHLTLDGIGVDTWGVDFGLLGSDGALVDNPRHYRDARNHGMVERACDAIGRERIFASTGVQFMHINSLYQWYAMTLAQSPALTTAKTLLFIPDLINYWLTGVRRAELTIASTSQFYDPQHRSWAVDVLEGLGMNASLLPSLVHPGEAIGPLLPAVADAAGLAPGTIVYATASHDTASAVAAVPANGEDWCYISSGTWSLMGVEIARPIVNARCNELNFTNEVGVDHSIRLLKNIAGLWIVQECRRAWAADGQDYSYAELTRLAAEAPAHLASIPVDEFLDPGHMPDRIAEHCRRTGQRVPQTPGEYIRVVLESLAARYAEVLDGLEDLMGRRLQRIHIIGGGSQNQLLNQLVADATNREVVAGPAEATAIGNIIVQAIGAGALANLSAARDVVRRSFPVQSFFPRK